MRDGSQGRRGLVAVDDDALGGLVWQILVGDLLSRWVGRVGVGVVEGVGVNICGGVAMVLSKPN